MHTQRVLVIGGGVAGPVLAIAPQQAGMTPTVHEAYPGPAYGIGGGLPPRRAIERGDLHQCCVATESSASPGKAAGSDGRRHRDRSPGRQCTR